MEYKLVADSISIDSLKSVQEMGDTLREFVLPFLGGEVLNAAEKLSTTETIPLLSSHPTWYFVLLFMMIASIALSRIFFGNLLSGALQSAFRYSVTMSTFNDNSQVQRQKDNILYLVYFVSSSFLIYLLELRYTIFPFQLKGAVLLVFNIGLLAVLFFGRIILLGAVARIFDRRPLFREYLYHIFSLNKLYGLIFVPLGFLLAYTRGSIHEIFMFLTVVAIGSMVTMKIFKGLIFSFKKQVFNFYLFLYLCALEIVPILLIYKWISAIV